MTSLPLATKITISSVGIGVVIVLSLVLVILPMSAPHNPETIEWLNQAECEELKNITHLYLEHHRSVMDDWIANARDWRLARDGFA